MLPSLVVASLLCYTTWMSSVQATHGPVSNCCLQWSNTRVRLPNITNYTIQQEGLCPITAIMFRTVLGKTLCSDPSSNWAKRAMQKVNKETDALRQAGQAEVASTKGKGIKRRKRRKRRKYRKRNLRRINKLLP